MDFRCLVVKTTPGGNLIAGGLCTLPANHFVLIKGYWHA